jgi:hypothetical protein
MLGSITEKMNIPYSMFPQLAKNGSVALPLEGTNPKIKYQQIAPIVIRDTYWKNKKVPNIIDLSDAELEKMYDDVIVVKWQQGD